MIESIEQVTRRKQWLEVYKACVGAKPPPNFTTTGYLTRLAYEKYVRMISWLFHLLYMGV